MLKKPLEARFFGLVFVLVEAKASIPLVGPKDLALSGASFVRSALSDLHVL